MMRSEILDAKEAALKERIAGYASVAVAYSGGVDSAYLADMAHETLGAEARVILADSPSIPRSEVRDASALAQARGWNFQVIATREFDNEAFLRNDGSRCFHCKNELFSRMDALARELGIRVLAYGEIADDLADPTRLGAQAARAYRVVAPLAEVELHKDEIRALSKRRGLPTWDKASFACLSSRFPVGARVELDALARIEAAEEWLKARGFRQYRARHHGDLVRIEVDAGEIGRLSDHALREELVTAFREIGYRHVTLDLAGYRTGSTAGLPGGAKARPAAAPSPAQDGQAR